VAVRKPAENKTEPKFAEAAEKTRVLIQGLQSRLRPEAGTAVQDRPDETQHDLERQLQSYFESSGGKNEPDEKNEQGLPQTTILNDIRARVVDGVVERILRAWDRPKDGQATPLENEVIERLIESVIQRLGASH
jgi:hypothetical protein